MQPSMQIADLMNKGMSQQLIANKAGIRSQSTVSRLSTGCTKNPKWRDVESIQKLYQFVVVEKKHWSDYDANQAQEA